MKKTWGLSALALSLATINPAAATVTEVAFGDVESGEPYNNPLPSLKGLKSLSVDFYVRESADGTVIASTPGNYDVTVTMAGDLSLFGIDLPSAVYENYLGNVYADEETQARADGLAIAEIHYEFTKQQVADIRALYADYTGSDVPAFYGYGITGVSVIDPTTHANAEYEFDLEDASADGVLEIVTTPDPGMVALFGFGSLGLALRRRSVGCALPPPQHRHPH